MIRMLYKQLGYSVHLMHQNVYITLALKSIPAHVLEKEIWRIMVYEISIDIELYHLLDTFTDFLWEKGGGGCWPFLLPSLSTELF